MPCSIRNLALYYCVCTPGLDTVGFIPVTQTRVQITLQGSLLFDKMMSHLILQNIMKRFIINHLCTIVNPLVEIHLKLKTDSCPHYLLAKQPEIQRGGIVAKIWKAQNKINFYVFYDEIKSCFKEYMLWYFVFSILSMFPWLNLKWYWGIVTTHNILLCNKLQYELFTCSCKILFWN